MAKNRMKKTEIIVKYETEKGSCELYNIDNKGFIVFREGDPEPHTFIFHAEAMGFIRNCLF